MTHKTIEPFGLWDIPGQAKKAGYILEEKIKFNADHYPGYVNRRGAGQHGGKKFPCEDAVTYKFCLPTGLKSYKDRQVVMYASLSYLAILGFFLLRGYLGTTGEEEIIMER